MKLGAFDIEEIKEYIQLAGAFQPIIKQIIESLVKDYGPLLKETLTTVCDGLDDLRIASFNNYLDSGFSREEAMQVLIAKICADKNQIDRSMAKAKFNIE